MNLEKTTHPTNFQDYEIQILVFTSDYMHCFNFSL